jgi:hypothetical protein
MCETTLSSILLFITVIFTDLFGLKMMIQTDHGKKDNRQNVAMVMMPCLERPYFCREQRLAKKYHDKLFKEYCIADLSRYKENKVCIPE